MTVIVTGAAGFIGFHVSRRLLSLGQTVIGIDNLNSYYDVSLKNDRLALLTKDPNFIFSFADIADSETLLRIFRDIRPNTVLHLAAQAGVRYSLENPGSYIQSNLVGFANILECCRSFPPAHLVYASSSSVYGLNTCLPFKETDRVDYPASLYAATKRSNELMAHSYSHLYSIPMTGLRFFTVYGPWGRPDMAPFIFAKAIFEDRPIQVFNNGQMQRDFTYIDDIVAGVVGILDRAPSTQFTSTIPCGEPMPNTSTAPFAIYNIGNNTCVALEDFICCLESIIGKKAIREYLPMQEGDVMATYADINSLQEVVPFSPKTGIKAGLRSFVSWFARYYGYSYGTETCST